jgi:hypothetical protein
VRFRETRVNVTGGVNEFLDRNIAIPLLTVKVTGFRRRVFHAKDDTITSRDEGFHNDTDALEGVVPRLSCVVDGDVVPTMCLIHINFPLACKS